jgi:hypothetical protein
MAQPATQAPSRRDARAIVNLSLVAIGVWLALNIAFHLLQVVDLGYDRDGYFGTLWIYVQHPIWHAFATYSFATLTLVAMGVVVAGTLSTWWSGHVLTAMVGALLLAGGLASMSTDLPIVLTVALFLFGVMAGVLAWRSWNGGRAAWSFAVALDGVLAVMTLFGAPKMRGLMGCDIWAALVPAVLSLAACVSMATLAPRYESEADRARVLMP